MRGSGTGGCVRVSIDGGSVAYGVPSLSVCAIDAAFACAIPLAPGNLPNRLSKLQFS